MTVAERIIYLLNLQGKEQKDLASHLNVGEQTISDWKSQKTESYKKYIVEIAEFFGCSTDYIYGKTDIPNVYQQDNNAGNIVNGPTGDNSPLTVTSTDLTEAEKEIRTILSNLNFRERTELMTMIYKFADEHKK